MTSKQEQHQKAEATAESVKKRLADPKRGLTRSQIETTERIARESWDEAGGDRSQAENALLWKAVTANIPLPKIQPLARSIWEKLGKPTKGTKDDKSDKQPPTS